MADSGYLVYLKKKIMCLKKDRLKDEARKRNLSQSGTKAKLAKRIIGGAEANLNKWNGIKISPVGPLARIRTRSQAAASKYFNIVFENTYFLLTVTFHIKRFNLSNLDFIPQAFYSQFPRD